MYKKLYKQPDMDITLLENCDVIAMSGTGWDDDYDNLTEGEITL